MNKTALALLLALPVATTALQGCFPAVVAGAGGAVLSVVDRRTAGTQLEDEGIELRGGNRISERYGDRVHINLNSYNRTVLISGEVPDQAAKAEVEKIVRGVPNVRGVANEVQIAGLASLGSRTNDSFITSKVKARFVDANRFSPVHVKVVTEAAVVYLMGLVTDAEANDAVEIARTTGGVRKVVKLFEYCKPGDQLCRPFSTPTGQSPEARPSP
jgi:osmotically-inducible protein OsmY